MAYMKKTIRALKEENEALKRENEAARNYIVNLESEQPFPNKYRDAWVKARRGDALLADTQESE